MTEKSLLWTTNNTGDGVSSGYTATEFFTLFRSWCPPTNQGAVFTDVLNELAASGSSSPVAINTGQALVYGIPYFNSASVNVTISTPATLTRIDRIVLRASWSAQTVRITRIAGTEGGAAPAITQNAGVTWDIPLCQVSITTGGAITLTDEREFIGNIQDSSVLTAMLADGAVTTVKIADSNVTTAKIAADNVTFAKMQNIATNSLIGRDTASTGDPENILLNATLEMDGSGNLQRAALTGDVTATAGSNTTALASNAVTTAKIADANVTLAKIQNIATDSLIGRDTAASGVPEVIGLDATLEMTGTGNLRRAALSGDVAASAGSNATAIGASKVLTTMIADANVTLAKMANLAADTIIGRANGAGTGVPTALTATQVRTIINVANGADVTAAGNVGTAIHGTTAKTSLVSADEIAIIDSAASNVLSRITYSNLTSGLAVGSSGDWTPNLNVNGSATGITYSGHNAHYYRVGNLLSTSGAIFLSSKGAGSGGIGISGFPVAYSSGFTQNFAIPVISWSGLSTAYIWMQIRLQPGLTDGTLEGIKVASTGGLSVVQASEISNTLNLTFAGTYPV
jgi:hypothetical protein